MTKKTKRHKKKKKGHTTLLIWNIPIPLKRKFKAVCAYRGLSMTEIIKQTMLDVVEK